jgi:hypothetical protein
MSTERQVIKNVFFDSVVIPALDRKIRYELLLEFKQNTPSENSYGYFIELPDLRYVMFFHSSSPIFYSENHYCRSIIFELKSKITNFKRMINRNSDEGNKRNVG